MSKRLITDRDVLEGRCGARIVLDGETLITPSARDRAMRLGIAVVEDGAESGDRTGAAASASAACPRCGAGGAACNGSGACTCAQGVAPVSLPDGLYLVRVEGGRTVCTLPAAGPGLMPRATSLPVSRS